MGRGVAQGNSRGLDDVAVPTAFIFTYDILVCRRERAGGMIADGIHCRQGTSDQATEAWWLTQAFFHGQILGDWRAGSRMNHGHPWVHVNIATGW